MDHSVSEPTVSRERDPEIVVALRVVWIELDPAPVVLCRLGCPPLRNEQIAHRDLRDGRRRVDAQHARPQPLRVAPVSGLMPRRRAKHEQHTGGNA